MAVLNAPGATLNPTIHAGPIQAHRACIADPRCAGVWRANANAAASQTVVIDPNTVDYLNAVNAARPTDTGAGVFVRRRHPTAEASVRAAADTTLVANAVNADPALTTARTGLAGSLAEVRTTLTGLGATTFDAGLYAAFPSVPVISSPAANMDIATQAYRTAYDGVYTGLRERGLQAAMAYRASRAAADVARQSSIQRRYYA
jgi:hypothetical protein